MSKMNRREVLGAAVTVAAVSAVASGARGQAPAIMSLSLIHISEPTRPY